MKKCNLDVIKPWITKRVSDLLGFDDDVIVGFIFNQLDTQVFIYEFLHSKLL